MFRLEGKVVAACAPQHASAFLADVSNEARWQKDIVHLQLVEGQAGSAGAKHERVQVVAGRNIKTVNELVEHVPGKRVRFHAVGKVIDYRVDYDILPSGKGSEIEMKLEGEMLGFASMFEGLAAEELRDAMPANLERLQQALMGPKGAG